MQQALDKIRKLTTEEGITTLGTKEVPWFPTKLSDFNVIGKRVLSEGDGI